MLLKSCYGQTNNPFTSSNECLWSPFYSDIHFFCQSDTDFCVGSHRIYENVWTWNMAPRMPSNISNCQRRHLNTIWKSPLAHNFSTYNPTPNHQRISPLLKFQSVMIGSAKKHPRFDPSLLPIGRSVSFVGEMNCWNVKVYFADQFIWFS